MNKSKNINSQSHQAKAYWKENVQTLILLLGIWFIVSFGMGILFVDDLDKIQFFGFHFGFWMAQQGSILVFVLLVFFYVFRMNRLDRKYEVDEEMDHYESDVIKEEGE